MRTHLASTLTNKTKLCLRFVIQHLQLFCLTAKWSTKETFCKALEMIREQERINDDFSQALQKVGNGYYVFGTENRYYDALLMVLKEAVNDQYDYISWWLYDTDDYIVETKDGSQKWDLREPEALYDYLVEEN